MKKQLWIGYLQVLTAALLWSLTGILLKSTSASAIWGNAIRTLSAGLFLLPVMLKYKIKINKQIIITGLIFFVFVVAFTVTTKIGNSAMAVSMQSAAPVYIIVFDIVTKRKAEASKLITLFLIASGVALSVIDALASANIGSIFFGFVVGFGFLAYSASLNKIKTHSAMGVIGGVNLVAFCCNAVALPLDFYPVPATLTTVMLFVLAGIFITGLSYGLYGSGIRKIGVETAMIVALAEPVLNPLWVFLGTGEAPSIMSIIGLGCILAGVVVNTLSFKTKAEEE
ncbi:DMT family transporter [Tyzzerella sp. OttesenSCG-928-J15]|nr:DMT family transporter [Tyzzerella sp. OttesenSCG-928-J15]